MSGQSTQVVECAFCLLSVLGLHICSCHTPFAICSSALGLISLAVGMDVNVHLICCSTAQPHCRVGAAHTHHTVWRWKSATKVSVNLDPTDACLFFWSRCINSLCILLMLTANRDLDHLY